MKDKDKKLIIELQRNGRASLTDLGDKFGVSHVAIKKRLEKLINQKKIVKVSPQISFSKLGLRLASINAEVESYDKLRELMKVFKQCPRVFFVANVTGKYNLLVLMYAEDIDTLRSIVDVCSIRAQKGIRKSEVSIGEIVYPEYVPIELSLPDNREVTPCGVNCANCDRFAQEKCLGCPATVNYRGEL